MSKKNKIIVSLSGIIFVALTLLGITFAYFMTRIKGNTSEKSVNVSTEDLALVYGDGNGQILTSDKPIMPSLDRTDAGKIGVKNFTVTNTSEETSYVVVMENVIVTNIDDGKPTTFESNDFRYTLTCKKADGTSCGNETSFQVSFPLGGGVIASQTIKKGEVHNYEFKLWYVDFGLDQSNDMGKTINARINIKDLTAENPYSDNTSTLAYNIVNGALKNENNIRLVNKSYKKVMAEPAGRDIVKGEAPTTFDETLEDATTYYISYADDYEVDPNSGYFTLVNKDGSEVQNIKYTSASASILAGKYTTWSNSESSSKDITELGRIYRISTNVSVLQESTIKYKTMYGSVANIQQPAEFGELSVTADDFGNSYYYRGNVQNNYVTFANMCWRIVRIKGNGSIKLILEDQDNTCEEMSAMTSTAESYNEDKGDFYIGSGQMGRSTSKEIDYLGSTNGMAVAFKNYQTTLAKKIDLSIGETPTIEQINNTLASKLESGDWCYNDKAYSERAGITLLDQAGKNELISNREMFYYDSYVRLIGSSLASPTLKCNGKIMNNFEDDPINPTPMYVASLTADEVAYAGGSMHSNNFYYLMNDYIIYRTNSDVKFWWYTISPSYYIYIAPGLAYSVTDVGRLYYEHTGSNFYRPSITLKPNTTIVSGGKGTITNPYVIN